MGKVSFEDIKRLKALTGVGVTDAKKALEEAGGDFDKATEKMREKGIAKAEKKADREARHGVVDAYVHSGRIGVLVEVNCETDFVAKTDEFKAFVHDIAMHVAASAPDYISDNDVPAAVVKKELDIEKKAMAKEKKPKEVMDKILEGKQTKFLDQICLLRQAYIKNPDQTVEDYRKEVVAKLGENIVIRNIARVELGQRD